MRSWSCVSGKNQRPLSMACGLYKMIMIQKPQRIQPGDSGFGFLLPINPPKIDTLLLHGVKQDGKVCIAKANGRKIERDCSLQHQEPAPWPAPFVHSAARTAGLRLPGVDSALHACHGHGAVSVIQLGAGAAFGSMYSRSMNYIRLVHW